MTSPGQTRAHRLRVMSGRDPYEEHRAATPLELLYDLTFVVAFGVASGQFAHLLAEGHLAAGLIGFGFGTFAICWAWINFSWFASAYDTDDWAFRLATMVHGIRARPRCGRRPPGRQSLAARLRRRAAVGRAGAVRLPNLIRRAYGPGWALVGDAGFHRGPVTGHGISDAFRDAELLARALDRALKRRHRRDRRPGLVPTTTG